MSNESENKLARRADDKRADRAVDWTDAPRFTALGIAETWAVTVEAEGQRVLSISDEHVAGLDGERLNQFVPTIRSCAQHLLGFIGAAPTSSTAGAAKGGITSLDELPYWSVGRTAIALPSGRYYAAADVERLLATTAGEQAEPAQWNDRDLSLMLFAMRRFVNHAYQAANEAAQDKRSKAGTAERLLSDAKDAEALAVRLQRLRSTQAAPAAPEQVQAKPAAWMVGHLFFPSRDAIPFNLLPPLAQPVPLYLAAPIAAAPAAEEVQTAAARIVELEAQLAECSALSQKWAATAGDADGRAEQAREKALEEAARIADGELSNTSMLTSMPPKSAAAHRIATAIRAMKRAASTEGEAP